MLSALSFGLPQAALENQALALTREELEEAAASENVACAWLPDGSVLRNAKTTSVWPSFCHLMLGQLLSDHFRSMYSRMSGRLISMRWKLQLL